MRAGQAITTQSEPGTEPRPGAPHLLVAVLGYGIIAGIFFWPMVSRIGTHLLSADQFAVPGKGGDEFRFLWMYWWFQKALITGHSVLHCDWVFPPTGANLTFRGIPFLPALLTFPIGWLFGPVVGTNVMICLMAVGGAVAYYVFLRRALDAGGFAAFWTAALFGFCPYFVWKAQGHYNLMGACWWATCLGVAVTAYARTRFTWKNAVIFGAFLWATFWSSYIEFFMLGITLVLMVAVWEAYYWISGRGKGVGGRVMFFLAGLPGVVSVLILWYGPNQTLGAPIEAEISLIDLIPSAKLSVFSWLGLPNRTEAIVPHTFVYLGLVGLYALGRKRERLIWPTGILALLLLTVAVDLFDVPSTVLRALPMGGAVRFFSRFLPFVFFFLLIFSCSGIDFLYRTWQPKGILAVSKKVVLGGLLAFAALELYPFLLAVTPVKHLPLAEDIRAQLHNGQFCMLVPEDVYYQNDESYPVDLDMPFVQIGYWWHMDLAARAWREEHFPAIYNGIPQPFPYVPLPDPAAQDFLDECRELRVGFLLFEDKAQAQRFRGNGSVLFENQELMLLRLERYDLPPAPAGR